MNVYHSCTELSLSLLWSSYLVLQRNVLEDRELDLFLETFAVLLLLQAAVVGKSRDSQAGSDGRLDTAGKRRGIF